MKKMFSYIFVIFLAACATPVSKLSEDQYVWTKETISINYQEAYRNLKKGLDVCDINLAIESNLYTDISEGAFVLYFKNLLGGNNGFVFGKINLKKENQVTNVVIGIQTIYAKPIFGSSKAGELMLKFAKGIYECE